jgi:hypothetical protein
MFLLVTGTGTGDSLAINGWFQSLFFNLKKYLNLLLVPKSKGA